MPRHSARSGRDSVYSLTTKSVGSTGRLSRNGSRALHRCATVLPTIVQETALRDAGHKLYGWVETDARFPLRTTISRFLNVGSYHILADDLRVGWHRDYESQYADPGDGAPDG